MIGLPVWYANWSESSLLSHALKHVLWAMANANSSDYIGLCGGAGGVFVCVCVGGGSMRDLIFVPVLHYGIFKL